jgi:pimeloyl-ACP methyl ester carboxylesterase
MTLNRFLAGVASLVIVIALRKLHAAEAGVVVSRASVDGIPVTVFRRLADGRRPVVVIAHGFAGSQQLMQSFALTFARNGYIGVTFDFAGHGRNPHPLTGSITEASGATRVLVDDLRRVALYARPLGDGRLAVLGHSMATDIVIRYAKAAPDVAATIAVSMFSPVVTATAPRNLLVIVGAWEGTLKREALRAVGLVTTTPQAGMTYGVPAQGTGRRAAFSPHVEHVGVLYSESSMREALAWLDQVFELRRTQAPRFDARGPWILALLFGVVLLARPLSTLLPRVAAAPTGAGRSWRDLWIPVIVPPIATPLLLRVLPTHFLPVLVGDYIAVHFAAYGILTLVCLCWTRPRHLPRVKISPAPAAFAAAAGAVMAYSLLAVVWPIDTFVTSFVPSPARGLLILAILSGTLLFFIRGRRDQRGGVRVGNRHHLSAGHGVTPGRPSCHTTRLLPGEPVDRVLHELRTGGQVQLVLDPMTM